VINIKFPILARNLTPAIPTTASYFSNQGILIHLTLLRALQVKKKAHIHNYSLSLLLHVSAYNFAIIREMALQLKTCKKITTGTLIIAFSSFIPSTR
jgi:hypothetical protein